MMRMPGPGGAVVVVGGRMTRMLGLGSSGGSGGMRGSGGCCFSGLAGGGCALLSSRSLGWDWRWRGWGGMGLEEGVRCLLVWIPQWGFCPVFAFSLSRGCVRCRRACVRSPGDLLAMAVRRGCRRRGGVGGSSSWPWPA